MKESRATVVAVGDTNIAARVAREEELPAVGSLVAVVVPRELVVVEPAGGGGTAAEMG